MVGLTVLTPSMSRLSRQCGILNISQPYRPPLQGTFALPTSLQNQTTMNLQLTGRYVLQTLKPPYDRHIFNLCVQCSFSQFLPHLTMCTVDVCFAVCLRGGQPCHSSCQLVSQETLYTYTSACVTPFCARKYFVLTPITATRNL
jgi:hypothetical protein